MWKRLLFLTLMTSWSRAFSETEWSNFKLTFNKTYLSEREETERKAIWAENNRRIKVHNLAADKGSYSFWLGVNHLGDMTTQEIDSTMKGLRIVLDTRQMEQDLDAMHGRTDTGRHPAFTIPRDMPKSVDWRKKGYVTPVKNQGPCGSCYSFSATGALEGQHFRKTGRLVSLSEQNIVDCTYNHKYHNRGCHGGLMDHAFRYVIDNGGIDTEKSYPYEFGSGPCRFSKSNVGATARDYVALRPRGNEHLLQAVVAQQGPVSVGVDARGYMFHFYTHGVYDNLSCSSRKLDHAMLVVGYGSDSDARKYWIVKNSWGQRWGLNGYIHMVRDQDNACGIASLASIPVV